MRHVIPTPQIPSTAGYGRPVPRASMRRAFGSVALVWMMAAGIVTLDGTVALAPDHPPVSQTARVDQPEVLVTAKAELALLDSGFSLGPAPASMTDRSPLPPRFEPRIASEAVAPQQVAQADEVLPLPTPAVAASPLIEAAAVSERDVPMPPERPSDMQDPVTPKAFRPSAPRIVQARASAPTPKTFDDRSFFEKFFGGLQQPSSPALGYAAPEDGLFGGQRRLTPDSAPDHDQWTAVYDISAHVVILPNGTRLEAHSGLGDRLDDPRYVHERMRGPTPPHLYDLTPREQLFHGVQALRLNPVGGGSVYGRTGLLAHTFMLGPNGDSNGCVSFRDYRSFLTAYQSGQVKRLMVVARQS